MKCCWCLCAAISLCSLRFWIKVLLCYCRHVSCNKNIFSRHIRVSSLMIYAVKESHKHIQWNPDRMSSNFASVLNVAPLVMNNISDVMNQFLLKFYKKGSWNYKGNITCEWNYHRFFPWCCNTSNSIKEQSLITLCIT